MFDLSFLRFVPLREKLEECAECSQFVRCQSTNLGRRVR
jgi:hypothetical protein